MTKKETRSQTNSDLIAPSNFLSAKLTFFGNDVNLDKDSSTFQYYFKDLCGTASQCKIIKENCNNKRFGASETKWKLSAQLKCSFFIITCISFTRIFWREVIVRKKNQHSCLIAKTFPRILKGRKRNTLWRHFNLKSTLICRLNSIHSKYLPTTNWRALILFSDPRSSFFLLEILIDYSLAVSLKSYFFSLCGSLKSKCHFKSELKISWGGNCLVVD